MFSPQSRFPTRFIATRCSRPNRERNNVTETVARTMCGGSTGPFVRTTPTAMASTSRPTNGGGSGSGSRSNSGGSTSNTQTHRGSGMGYGNVSDQMLASFTAEEEEEDSVLLHRSRPPLFQHTKAPHTCSIIGAPMTYGQPYAGTDTSPTLLREAGLRGMLSHLGWRVEDLPDLSVADATAASATFPIHDNAKNSELVGAGAFKVYEMVKQKFQQGSFPLILGGDHSIGIGSLAAILSLYPDTGILWIDAHADLNTPHVTQSGNMHGMPIGLHIQGMDPPLVDPTTNTTTVAGLEWMQEQAIPQLPPDSIVYIGLRDVDIAERRLIRSLKIPAFTMHDIDRYGIGTVMEMSLNHLFKKNPHRRLHLSYDIDAIDPVLAPATGTTVRGGLTYREAHYVAERVAYTGQLASAEIVEMNPTLSDTEGARETVELGLQIITSFMGKSII